MRHRWGRWSLVAVAVALAAGACAWALQLEAERRATRANAVAAAGFARSGRAALGDVRRALAAMASPGQAAAGWSRRAEAAIDDARRHLDALTALTAVDADRRAALDVFDRLGESERRLREHATGGKPLMAADVAFGEAMPHVDDLERRLDAGHEAVAAATEQSVAGLRDRQVAALAAAMGALLVATLLLAPLPGASPVGAATARQDTTPDDALAIDLSVRSPVPDLAPLESATAGSAAGPAPVDLPALGTVCERLAAVREADSLPALLEDAARAIGAQGAMLWLADPQRRTLRLAAAAGYDARLVARIGPVSVADDHATARALRDGVTVSTTAKAGQPAAAAVPVRSGDAGIAGVLAVEFGTGSSTPLPDATAAAAILAAQLSLLVGSGADDGAAAADTAGAHGS
ncbi:MAG: hypothetical protein AB7U83_08835 [Vicinamibacterales bacterium]